jgi:hypothetical protein
MRRVVTGQGAHGRSMVLSDGPAPQAMVLDRLGGAMFETLWQLLTPPESPTAGGDPTGSFFQIRPGLVSFFRTTFPPDSRIDRSDMRAVHGEMQQKVPDLVPLLDPARGPGMRATDSLDLVVVVAGGCGWSWRARKWTWGRGMRSCNKGLGMPGATRGRSRGCWPGLSSVLIDSAHNGPQVVDRMDPQYAGDRCLQYSSSA